MICFVVDPVLFCSIVALGMHHAFNLIVAVVVIDDILKYFFFSEKIGLTFHVNYLLGRQFSRNVKPYFLRKIKKYLGILCATIFYGAVWLTLCFPDKC